MSAPKGNGAARRAAALPCPSAKAAPPREPMARRIDICCRATPTRWPMDDAGPRHAAETGALARPGAAGFVSSLHIGEFSCGNRLDRCAKVRRRTMVCPMAVGRPVRRSQGRKGCMCRCFPLRMAARRADDRENLKLLKDLAGNPERLTKNEEMRGAS